MLKSITLTNNDIYKIVLPLAFKKFHTTLALPSVVPSVSNNLE